MTMPTLSLCMIVGKGEAQELENCLKSVQGPLFDQIVVVTTQQDDEVAAVARKYATEVHHFDWINDFAAARNYSFSFATSDFVMWLDADDEISTQSLEKLIDLKPKLQSFDLVMLAYNYAFDGNNNPIVVLPRERIIRRDGRMKWSEPIHECLILFSDMRIERRNDIFVDHRRKRAFNPERNLQISRKFYEEGKASQRLKFYYAKDLIESGRHEEAIPVFEDYLSGPTDYADNKAIACLRMAEYYRLKGMAEEHKAYLLKGRTYSTKYAEFPFLLGDIHYNKGELKEAIPFYEACLATPMDAGFSMQSEYYKFLPADRLSMIHYKLRDLKKSLYYNGITLECRPDDGRILSNRKMIQDEMASETHKEPSILWLVHSFNPQDPAQRLAHLDFNQLYRKFGAATSRLGVAFGMRNLARLARALAYPSPKARTRWGTEQTAQ